MVVSLIYKKKFYTKVIILLFIILATLWLMSQTSRLPDNNIIIRHNHYDDSDLALIGVKKTFAPLPPPKTLTEKLKLNSYRKMYSFSSLNYIQKSTTSAMHNFKKMIVNMLPEIWQTYSTENNIGLVTLPMHSIKQRIVITEKKAHKTHLLLRPDQKRSAKIKRTDYNEHYEKLIKEEESLQVPGLGDRGAAVILDAVESAKAEEIMKTEAFNLLLSNKLMYNRTIDDARDPLCKNLKYDTDLPTATVIIIFNNERWSSLIRTIHSVLNGTPRQLLAEIILVDDFSDHEELKGKLDYYISTRLPKKVRLHRLLKRSGLIRARLAGARLATADVIVFLDAHCEVGPLWMEPLLQRIKNSRTSVVVPIIDVIDDKTFEYQHNQGSYSFQVGGFTWSGHFTWVDISQKEVNRRGSAIGPTRSPTMAGGLFAIDRNYFWESGSYDEKMDIWGGENLEMSFRVWLCGGSIETIPCSRVGHIFRSFHPYSFPNKKDTHGINTARLVNVWMGPYSRIFYLHRPDLKEIDIGDTKEREALKSKLKCKPFKWYLENIFADKFIPDEQVIAYGAARTKTNNLCLDNLQAPEEETSKLGIYPCHAVLHSSQFYSLSKNGELRREFVCAEVTGNDDVEMTRCSGTREQKWKYTATGSLVHLDTRKCLDSSFTSPGQHIKVNKCFTSTSQMWLWDYRMVPRRHKRLKIKKPKRFRLKKLSNIEAKKISPFMKLSIKKTDVFTNLSQPVPTFKKPKTKLNNSLKNLSLA